MTDINITQESIATLQANNQRLKEAYTRYFNEAANAQEECKKLRKAIELALECTPHVVDGAIVYDCGDPWGVLQEAIGLSPLGEELSGKMEGTPA